MVNIDIRIFRKIYQITFKNINYRPLINSIQKGLHSLIFLLAILINKQTMASRPRVHEIYPAPLLKQDNFFSHHVLIAEKSTHQLHLFGYESNGKPKYIKAFQIATGKKRGNKRFKGDYRTPEGIYQLTRFIPRAELLKTHGKAGEIYGVGAFVMDYPNPIDRFHQKTGGGIWLHSTNDETRIDKGLDSRGCVVMANNDLKSVSQFIELDRTPIIIVQDLHFLTEVSWTNNQKKLKSFIESWLDAWKNENLEKYIEHYHPNDFYDFSRGNYQQFKNYKKAVFSTKGKPEIVIDNITLLQTANYALAIFRQEYKSSTINDIGKKMLYLKKDEYYNWKIVSEKWKKLNLNSDNQETVAFQPSMRFFDNPTKEKN